MRQLLTTIFLTAGAAWGQYAASASGSSVAAAEINSKPAIRSGTDLPATCTAGKDLYAHTGTLVLHFCTGANTWTATTAGLESALTFSAPLSRATNTISLPAATGSVNGYLSSTDWTTFNNKQAALGFTAAPAASPTFTGTVTLPVTGSLQCLHVNSSGVLSGTGSDCGSGGGGADSAGYYWVSRAANAPANASNLGLLTSGLVKITVAGGVATPSTAAAGTDYQAPITDLTTGALMTAASAGTVQTPNASATMDASGNISTPGTITTGASGAAAGVLTLSRAAGSAGSVVLQGATSGATTVKPADAVTAAIVLPGASDTLVGRATTDTLSNKTLTTPTIASLVNANHDHSNAAGGGNISSTAVGSGDKAGNGTKFQMFTGASPSANDCAKFDASGNLVTAGAACGSGGGSSYDVTDSTVVNLVDEFFGSSTASGSLGQLYWTTQGTCTTTASSNSAFVAIYHVIGSYRFTAPNSANGVCAVSMNGTGDPFYGLNTKIWTAKLNVYMHSLTQTDAISRFGFGAGNGLANQTPTTAVVVEAKKGTDTNWYYAVYSGGSLVGSRVDTGVPFSDADKRVALKLRGDGTNWYLSLSVDGGTFSSEVSVGASATYAATLPSAGIGPFFHFVNNTNTTGTSYYVDRFSMNATGLLR